MSDICLKAWLYDWFELDRQVGSALSCLDIWSHGTQLSEIDDKALDLRRTLAARREHFKSLPKPPCTCGACDGATLDQPLDLIADLHLLRKRLEHSDTEERVIWEACDDMAEFIVTHKLKWHVLKDNEELEEAARNAGFVMAERDDG